MGKAEKQTILVVDDTPENIDVLDGILNNDYKIKAALNGERALKIIHGENPPDLVLLDIMMPNIDGYEVCRRIKANGTTTEIPVIFITAKNEVEDEVKGFEIGGVDYITKPISPPIVLARVKTHLALMRQREILKENMQLREDVERITRHDLKSPLNGIINYPAIIKSDGDLSGKQLDNLDKIIQLGRKMLNMINLSLDLYRMEKRTYTVRSEMVNVLDVINEIIAESRIRLKSKRLTVKLIVDGEVVENGKQFMVKGEKLLLYSLLSNLFKNAVEASPKKENITLTMNHGRNDSVSIHNRGDVPVEIRDHFFEKYATAGKSGGTGLGTYSARLITETLGGKISLDTSAKNGTTVRIDLPLNQ